MPAKEAAFIIIRMPCKAPTESKGFLRQLEVTWRGDDIPASVAVIASEIVDADFLRTTIVSLEPYAVFDLGSLRWIKCKVGKKGQTDQPLGRGRVMVEVFAIAACYYYSDPTWAVANQCQLVQDLVFNSRAQCEEMLERHFKRLGSIEYRMRTIFICVHKTVSTWQPN